MLALAGSLGFAAAATAQGGFSCGITGSAQASPILFDPFQPGGLPVTTVTLTLTRVNLAGGAKTDVANFYLQGRDGSADGAQIVPISVSSPGNVSGSGTGENIFHNFSAPKPLVSPASRTPSPTQRFLKLSFNGNNEATNTVTIVFNVILPENFNVEATQNLPFDAYFGCSTSGGQGTNKQEIQGTVLNALTFPITVLSALQASYAGTALDFGEVGDKTTGDVLAAPATYTTPTTNHVRVRSSGPYTVALASQNTYKMTFPGGVLTTPTNVLNYDLKFLGQTRNAASPSFTTVTCQRAGVPASDADILPVVATLKEGGQGKLVSPTYSDLLTVTITPLLSGAPSQQNCPAL
ncbi:hypothetical protein [Sphingopyxis macrogoltabida]|uniref:hypothetical protein n=1 Tax=Sphingopyxis macrogoltabida TaxID=33050 RepID=UPI0006D29F07|nr:hypothetical protein [Sphingopyxis macrogoltabida]